MSKYRDQSQQSEQQEDDNSQQDQKIQIRKPKIDRIDKFKNFKKIVINVSMTQYPVVTQVAQSLDWKIQTSNDLGDWDVYWTDLSIDPDVLIKMHLFQKINHYPGIFMIARKNLLAQNLLNMSKKFPNQYNFFPMTWLLPHQYAEFRMFYQSKQKGKTRTYIVKPQAQCQGRGIFLTRKIQDMETGKHYVVQRYIAKPYLIEGLKFDFRIYILLCGTDPLKLYMYNQGLARLATQQYQQPMNANLDRLCMHLTNYAINKFSPHFIFNNSINNMGIGHKRALSCVFKQLAQKGLDIDITKSKIKDIIIKTIISGLPLITHQYKYSQPQDYTGNMCFHILGLDVMLNNKGQPFVLQVNHTPSFTTDTPLDHKIKFNLIKDTLILMNVNVKQKNQLINKCKQYNSQRLITGKRHIYEGQDREQKIKQAQQQRQKYEKSHLGGFEKIYPLQTPSQNQKYQQMIKAAMQIYQNQNQNLRQKYQLKKQMKHQIKKIKLKSKQKNIIKNKLYPTNYQQPDSTNENLDQPTQQSSPKKTQDGIFKTLNNTPRDANLTLSQPIPIITQQQVQYGINQLSPNKNISRQLKKINDQFVHDIGLVKANKNHKMFANQGAFALIAQKRLKQIQKIQQCQSKLLRRQLYLRQKKKRSLIGSNLKMSDIKNQQLPKQLPNIQSAGGFTHGYTQLIQQQSTNNRKRQKVFSYQTKQYSIKSQQKFQRQRQKTSKQKDYKNINYKKIFNHGQYVMPKIFLINVDQKKQKDKDKYQIPFIPINKKIQLSTFANNA